LTGHVASCAEKAAAETAARRVKGVRAVAQEIEVRFPGGRKTADDQIALRILDIFRWSALIPHGAIDVTVNDGWVRLTGEVNWHFERMAAEDEVRRLNGVVGVINDIAIRQPHGHGDVVKAIEKALKRNAAVAGDVTVRPLGSGKVRIEGHVHNWHERQLVENAAWSAPGVTAVEDALTVG